MKHQAYARQGTGKNAVLLIHGIAGSPDHFRDLVPLIPESFSVCNLLLAGHSGTPGDFGHASMAKWKAQVTSTLDDLLSRHEKVVIVGHSMGTLFAIRAAIAHPDRIYALFLLNVPTRIRVHPKAMIGSLQVAFGRPRSATARAMQADTGIALSPRFWEYLGWIPRMLELLQESHQVRKLLPGLTVPALVFQSRKDELVSRVCKDFTNSCITCHILAHSGHFAYSKEDTALLQQRFTDMLEKI